MSNTKKQKQVKKVMSLAIDPDLHSQLKSYARKKDVSASAYVCNLVTKALKLPIDDDPVIVGKPADKEILPVVLKIPMSLKDNKASMRHWLDMQAQALTNRLCPGD